MKFIFYLRLFLRHFNGNQELVEKILILKNIFKAEFIGGTLICNGKVAIKRSANGQVQLEGALSEDYFKIRKLLYDCYAII